MSSDDFAIAKSITGLHMDADRENKEIKVEFIFENCPLFKEKELKLKLRKDGKNVKVTAEHKLSFSKNSKVALFKQLAGESQD